MNPSAPGLRPAVLLVVATFLWGAATVANKALLGPIAPTALLAIQLAPGFLLAAALALLARARFPRGRDLALALLLGVLNPGISYMFSMLGLSRVSASLAALLWASEPMMILVLATLILREPLGIRLVAAIVAGFGGVVLVVRPGGGGADAAGVGMLLTAVALCAVYTVFSRGLVQRCDALPLLAVQHGAGLGWAVAALALNPVASPPGSGGAATGTLAAAAMTGFLYYGISYWLYLLALRRVPAAVAGAWFNLIPLFALILAALFLGERLGSQQLLGAAVILGAALVLARETGRTGDP